MAAPSEHPAFTLAGTIARGCLIVALTLLALWADLAVLYQAPLPPALRLAVGTALAAVFLVTALSIYARRGLQWTLPAAFAFAVAMAIWWAGITPSDHRNWQLESSRRSVLTIRGNDLEVRNVRIFDWTGPDQARPAWEDRLYSLSDLRALDLFVSTWGNDDIAHTMLSFVFGSGPPLVLSLEIRKEEHEAYSPIAGFFKTYEFYLIAADEADILRVRTNFRGETVRRYRIDVKSENAAKLLAEYVALSQDLDAAPRFYHTVWTNCTTAIYAMLRRISPSDFPYDFRVLISGRVPEYLYERGFIDRSQPFDEVRRRADVTMRAKLSGAGDFTAAIRR